MNFIGLLTHQQKQAGFFITQDDDFVYLWRGRNGSHPDIVGIWLYEDCRIKQVRDMADAQMELQEERV